MNFYLTPNSTKILYYFENEHLFSSNFEKNYLTFLTIITIFSIFAHIITIIVALFFTPKELINYRLTVTNTTSWSLLMVIYYGLLFRPVPFFPLSIGKVTGILKLANYYISAQTQFIILIVIIANFLIAAIICFLVICVIILDQIPKQIKRINKTIGIKIAILCHITTSIIIILFIKKYYCESTNLKEDILLEYPFLEDTLGNENIILFGFFVLETSYKPR